MLCLCKANKSTSIYLLLQLKSQGTNVQALYTLFTGLIMSKIAYALPAFAGQLSADDRNRIGAISRKALRRGVNTHSAFDIEEIIDSADRKLFTRIAQPGHCLAYIIFFFPKPLHSALIVSGKDNILTNSLTSNSHSTKTVLSIDVYLNSDDY